MRYSKLNVLKALKSWEDSVISSGMMYKKCQRDQVDANRYDLGSVDIGILLAVGSLILDIEACPKLSKRQFLDMIYVKREIIITLPVNEYLFTEHTGYNQIKDKSSKQCEAYGKFVFYTSLIRSIFSEYF